MCIFHSSKPLYTLHPETQVIVIRIEATTGNEYKVSPTNEEIEDLCRVANSTRDDIPIQLGAFVGLWAFENQSGAPDDVKETESGQYQLRLRAGKDTGGNGRKAWDACLQSSVEGTLQRYQNEHNIASHDPYIGLSQLGARAVVRRTSVRAADTTDNGDSEKVSTNDLRRRFAQRFLVDEQMNSRVVMAVGGWDPFGAVKSYLNAPNEDVVDQAFTGVELR